MRTLQLACVVLLASVATAQSPEGDPSEGLKRRGMSVGELETLLHDRERGNLHPGIPLDLIGHEENGNGFRHKTPLLEKAMVGDQQVDVEDLRERRMSMFTEGSQFHSPPARALGSAAPFGVGSGAARARSARSGSRTSSKGTSNMGLSLFFWFIGLAALGFRIVQKRREIMEDM